MPALRLIRIEEALEPAAPRRRDVRNVSESEMPDYNPELLQLGSDDATAHPESGLARELSELAQALRNADTLELVLEAVVTSAVSEVTSTTYAGISEITPHRVVTKAASDPVVEEIDAIQYDLGDGPCLTSLHNHATVRADDLATDERWPKYSAAAVERGVRSTLSVRLFVGDEALGVLNLYSSQPRAFDDNDEQIAVLLAAHAAVAMKGRRIEANLRSALESRDVIGQAKGILMERLKVADDQAFALLVSASQRSHRKLRDIAEELTRTGEISLP